MKIVCKYESFEADTQVLCSFNNARVFFLLKNDFFIFLLRIHKKRETRGFIIMYAWVKLCNYKNVCFQNL